ncbi:hypothetical protein THAOC_19998, partial [Thalassiosira oceanica]
TYGLVETAHVEDSMVTEAIDEASAALVDREDSPSDATKNKHPQARATVMELAKEQSLATDEKGPCAPPSEAATDSDLVVPSDLDGDEISRAAPPAPPSSADSLEHCQNVCAATEQTADFNEAESTSYEQAASTQIETKDDTGRLTMDGETGKVDNPEKSQPLEAQDCVMESEISQVKSDGSEDEITDMARDIDESEPKLHSDLTKTEPLEKPEDEACDVSKSSEKSEHSNARSPAEQVSASVPLSNEGRTGAQIPVDSSNSGGDVDNEISSCNETELTRAVPSGVESENVESAVDKAGEPSGSSNLIEEKEEAKDAIPAIWPTSLPSDEASGKIGIDDRSNDSKGESSSLGNNKEEGAHTPQTGVDGVLKDGPGSEMVENSTAKMKFGSEMPPAAEVEGASIDREFETSPTAEKADVVVYPSPETNKEVRLTDGPQTENESLNLADLEALKMPNESEIQPAGGPASGEKPTLEPNAKEMALSEDQLSRKSRIDESSDVDVADNSVIQEDGGVGLLACAEDLYLDAKESDKLEDEIKANANDMMSIESDPNSRDGDAMQHIIDPVSAQVAQDESETKLMGDLKSLTASAEDSKAKIHSNESTVQVSTEISGLAASDLTKVVTDVNLIASTEEASPSGEEATNQATADAAAAAAKKSPPNDSEQRTDDAEPPAKFDENTRDDEGPCPMETKKVDVNDSPLIEHESAQGSTDLNSSPGQSQGMNNTAEGSHFDQAATVAENIPLDDPNLSTDGAEQPTEPEEKTNVDEALCPAETKNIDSTSLKSSSLVEEPLVEEPLVEDKSSQGGDGPQPQGLYSTANDPHHSSEVKFHVAADLPLRKNETSEEVHQPKVSSQTSGTTDADIPANSVLGVLDDQDKQTKHRDEGGLNSTPAMQERNAPQCQIGGGESSVPKEAKLPEMVPLKRELQAKNEMEASSPTDSTNSCPAGPLSADDTLMEDNPEDLKSSANPADPKVGRRKTGVVDEKCSDSPSSDAVAVVDKPELESSSKREDPIRAESEPSSNQTNCKDGDADDAAPCTSVVKPTKNEENRDAAASTADPMKKSSSVGLLSMDNGSTAGHFSLDNVLSPGADLIDISAGLIGGPAQQQEALNSTLALAGDSAMFDDLDAFDFDDADKHMDGDSGTNKPPASRSHSLGDIVGHSQISNLPPDVSGCVNNSDALTSMALASDELLGSLVAGNAGPNASVVGAGPPNTSQVRENSSEAKPTVPGSNPVPTEATGTSTANLLSGQSEQSRAILDEKKAQPSTSDSSSPKKDGTKPSIRLRFMKKRIGRELPTKKRRQESPKAHDAPNQQPKPPIVVQESKPKKKKSSVPSPTRLPQSGVVSLRGKLTRHIDGTHKIAGTWALGLDTILADPDNSKGVALDFEYEHSPSPAAAEGLDFPSSGSYSGWFHILGENGCKVKSPEKDVELKYVKNSQGGYNVQGQGSNVYGKFTVKGLLTQDGTITMCRQFVPAPRPPSRKRKDVDGSSAPQTSKKPRKGDTSSTSRPSTAEAISGFSRSESSTNANVDYTAEQAASEESKRIGGALSESVLLPDGPSSLPGTWTLGTSKKVPQYYTSSVLAGWVEQLIPRKDSKSRHARYEKFYLCPDGGRFRSLVQARSHAEKLMDLVDREEDGKSISQGHNHHLDGSGGARRPKETISERMEGSTERSAGISDNEAADTADADSCHVNRNSQEDHAVTDDKVCHSAAKSDSLPQSQVSADTEQVDGSAREDTQLDIVNCQLTEGVMQKTNHLANEETKCSGVIVEDRDQHTKEGCAADQVKHSALTGSTPKPAEEFAETNLEIETKVDQSTKPADSADETSESAQLTKPAASTDETSESAAESLKCQESKTEVVTQPAEHADVSSDMELNDERKTEDTKLAVLAGETLQPVESPIDVGMEEGKKLEGTKPTAAVNATLQPFQALAEMVMDEETPTKMDLGMESEAKEVNEPSSSADETSKLAREPIGIPFGEENKLDVAVTSAASATTVGENIPFADESTNTDLEGERTGPSSTEGNAADAELEEIIPSRGKDATETNATGSTDETQPSLQQDIRNDMPATDLKDTSSMNMLTGTEKKGSSTFSTARDDPTLEDGPANVNAVDADVSDGMEQSDARPGPTRGVSFNRNLTLEEQSNAGRRNYVYQRARQSAPHLKRPLSTDVEMSGHSKKRRRSSSVKRVSSRVDPIKVGDPVLVLCNLSDSFGYTEKQPVYGLVKRARRSNTGLQVKVKYIDGEMSEEMPYPFADLQKLDKLPVPSDFTTFGIGDIVDSNLQDKGLFYRGRIYSIRGEWAFIEYFDGDCESAVPLNKNKTSLVQKNKNWNWIQNRPILLESDGDGADEAGFICEVNANGCKIEVNQSGETRVISHEDAAEAVFRHNCNNLPTGCENYSWGFLRPQSET